MDAPADICVDACVTTIVLWYLIEYRGGMDLEASYYFDIGEPFEAICKAKWERELAADERLGSRGPWNHIKHIGPAQMKSTPGLQVADMLSWSLNREAAYPEQRYAKFAIGMKHLMPTKWTMVGESKLRQLFKPLIYRVYDPYQI